MKIGLTGGVGAGKSTVAGMLAERGAVVIDADAIAREVVRRGTPGFDAVVARFGDQVVQPDGELDRARLGQLVFADPVARADLEAIVHPLVASRSAQLMNAAADGSVLVYDVPLLVENDLAGGFHVVVVVEAGPDTRLRRLAERGLTKEQAWARMAAQATDEQRRAVADIVVTNDGSRADLEGQVADLWHRLTAPATTTSTSGPV